MPSLADWHFLLFLLFFLWLFFGRLFFSRLFFLFFSRLFCFYFFFFRNAYFRDWLLRWDGFFCLFFWDRGRDGGEWCLFLWRLRAIRMCCVKIPVGVTCRRTAFEKIKRIQSIFSRISIDGCFSFAYFSPFMLGTLMMR